MRVWYVVISYTFIYTRVVHTFAYVRYVPRIAISVALGIRRTYVLRK